MINYYCRHHVTGYIYDLLFYVTSCTASHLRVFPMGGLLGGRGGENGLAPPPKKCRPPGKKVVTPPLISSWGGERLHQLYISPSKLHFKGIKLGSNYHGTLKNVSCSNDLYFCVQKTYATNFFFLFRFPPPQHGDSPPQIHPPRWGGEIKKFAPPAKKA